MKKVNNCLDCANSFRSSEFLVYARQIICYVNKLLKTQAHRRNILKVVLEYFKDWNVNMNWHECIEHHNNIFNIIVLVISTKSIVYWCEKKNLLINDNFDDKLQCDLTKDIVVVGMPSEERCEVLTVVGHIASERIFREDICST